MSCNQAKVVKTFAVKHLYVAVGMLLLFIFIGRVGLVSMYGYAGVQKPAATLSANANPQEDTDQNEEGKYAEKQFKCFSLYTPFEFLSDEASLSAKKVDSYIQLPVMGSYLTVLTPPPNC